MAPLSRQDPKIVERGAFTVAGLRYEGRNEHGEVPAMWDRFLPRVGELGVAPGQPFTAYGVARAIAGVPVEEKWEYLAGVEVASLADLSPGMVGWEIPALTYAVLPAYDVPEIGPVSDYFFQQWLPNSAEYAMGDGPMIEVYPDTFGTDGLIHLYFPVRRKGR
jgi:AraC family transcriptional regulator